jgi:integrase
MTDLIASYEAHMKAAGYARNTVVDRVELLRRVDSALPLGLAEATTEELAAWLARDGWSRQTRATYYGHVRGFYAYHCDPNRRIALDWDPSAGLIRPRAPRGVPRPVTDDELEQALAQLDTPWSTYVRLAAYAGLRSFEIAQIKRREVNQHTITVAAGKGGRSRVIPTHPVIWQAIRHLGAGLIAEPSSTGRLCADLISGETARLSRVIGLIGFTLHRCRHWYGTMLLRPKDEGGAGANLRAVQELLGHASPLTTAIYTLVTDEQRRNAVAALPALAPTPH